MLRSYSISTACMHRYAQDEWNISENLKLTGGIRFDMISFNSDDLMRNNAIYELNFGGRHIDTGAWPDGNVQVSPRIGFTWDVFGDKSLKVRGGTGLFAGRLPLVFFTNMPTNSGMVQNLVHADTRYEGAPGVVTSSDPRLQNFVGGLVTDVNNVNCLERLSLSALTKVRYLARLLVWTRTSRCLRYGSLHWLSTISFLLSSR